MPIYELRPDDIHPATATSFEAEGIRERVDLQRLLKQRIECLEEGLLVLAEEFSDWADSTRRIDLLCLDTDANLVVVELKRTDDGGHMELQALPNANAATVRYNIEGGYRSPKEDWPVIQDRLIDAMIRMDQVFRRRVAAL